jgi:hypothetical protein
VNVGELRRRLTAYPDDTHVGVHFVDSRRGHRLVSASDVDMTTPFEEVPVPVVWISALVRMKEEERTPPVLTAAP